MSSRAFLTPRSCPVTSIQRLRSRRQVKWSAIDVIRSGEDQLFSGQDDALPRSSGQVAWVRRCTQSLTLDVYVGGASGRSTLAATPGRAPKS